MWRISALFLTISCAFILIITRLFYWQVLSYGRLATEASNQYFFKLELPAKRGEILSSDKSSLVTNQVAYLVYAEPKKIENKKIFARTVGKILEAEGESILERISEENIVWVTLGRKIDEEKTQKLKDKNLTGIGFEKEGKRFYSEASMAAQLIGFVGSDSSGEDKGYFGIEGYYNRELQGRNGSLVQEKDAKGLPILLGEEQRFSPEDGRTLVLHLDKTVQYILEKELRSAVKRYGASEGIVVVSDPKSGGILGMASNPSYDPQDFLSYPKERYTNPVVASTYEPGSTFKTLIIAAALNEKAIKPDTIYDEKGKIQIGEYSIKTWNDEYHGEITIDKILQHSSNVGMVFIGEKLGKKKLLSYLDKFGFGKPTNIDLEEEAVPRIRERDEWTPIDLATVTFGQGIAVTPIQMIQAVGAIANKGVMMEPQLVERIIDPKGKVIINKPKVANNVISDVVAKTMTEMMVQSVDYGDAKWAKPKGYRIAGKTGTAQIPVEGHYDEEKTIASFVGFAPADDPKFVMLVTLREPTSSPWGSETAAPLFFDIAGKLLSYYGIPPRN